MNNKQTNADIIEKSMLKMRVCRCCIVDDVAQHLERHVGQTHGRVVVPVGLQLQPAPRRTALLWRRHEAGRVAESPVHRTLVVAGLAAVAWRSSFKLDPRAGRLRKWRTVWARAAVLNCGNILFAGGARVWILMLAAGWKTENEFQKLSR